MPGMPIFQDSPSQLKGQIYVLNSANQSVVPLQVDNDGNLSVDLASGAEVTLAPGAEVTLAAGTDIDNVASVTTLGTITNDVKVINGATPLEVELAADTEIDIDTVNTVTSVGSVTTLDTITNDVKVINGATPLTVGLAAGTNLIGKVERQLVFNNVDSFGANDPLEPMAVGIGATVEAAAQNVSLESSYCWYIKNQGTTSDQDITLKVEISPDGANWVEDTGTEIEVPANTSKIITVTHFLQFVRFVITGGLEATTVISCFQSQH